MVDLAGKYAESQLDKSTEKYSLSERKKIVSFTAYDIEQAFEEGQKNPKWNYNEVPESGITVLGDDLYQGIIPVTMDKNENWLDMEGNPVNIDRWIPMPV